MRKSKKEENEKKKYIYLAVGLFVLVVMVTGATYAYFALTASNNNTITGNVGGATLSLTVTKKFPTANTNMIPQLESTLGDAISDKYSCVDDHNNVVCQVYQATVRNTGTTTAELEGVISFQNINTLPNLKWARIETERTMGTYTSYPATTAEALFETKKVLAPTESASYYFVIWIDEIEAVQTDQGTFRATINFRTGGEVGGITSTIRPGPFATQFMQNLYNDGSALTTVHIGGDDSKPTVTQNATQGIMLDNNGEYRYYGASPKNYVTFNGELWRIISVSNVKSNATDTTGAMRMKIIRNDSIGDYSWDSSESTINSGFGINEWSKADLNTELNTLYYNSQSGTCYNDRNNVSTTCDFTTIGLQSDAKSMIEGALWYLGGKNVVENLDAADYYTLERSNTVYDCSVDDGACPRTTTWEGNVGLMYPSDYMYATDLSQCSKVGYSSAGSEADYSNATCVNNNWLYNLLGTGGLYPLALAT